MKIGIMLRHYNQHGGGVWVYTHNLLKELLALPTSDEYVLIYQDPKLVGTYQEYRDHVREIAIKAPGSLLWDQAAVLWAEKREKLDLLFNPKYSLPLLADCRTMFICHGLDWYVMPWGSKPLDRLSHRFLVPSYTKKADAIIAVSDTTRQHLVQYLGVPEEKVYTVYHGISDTFKKPVSDEKKEEARRKYRLPDRFFLYVGQIYPPKNFGRLLKAYAQVGPGLGIPLVVAGEHRWLSEKDISLIDCLNISKWVVRTGWIDHEMLPGLYAMAEALLLPSLYESFGFPVIEAMSMGCPVVTSNRCGTKELADQAAILVDPEDVDSIAEGLRKVALDDDLRSILVKAGRERSECFSWKKCAFETLRVLNAAARNAKPVPRIPNPKAV